jgi:hypothetical protein
MTSGLVNSQKAATCRIRANSTSASKRPAITSSRSACPMRSIRPWPSRAAMPSGGRQATGLGVAA